MARRGFGEVDSKESDFILLKPTFLDIINALSFNSQRVQMLCKKIFLFFLCYFLFFMNMVYAREQIISPLPIPKQEVIDLSIKKCSKSCLKKLYEDELFFSFIAIYSSYFKKSKDKDLIEKFDEIANNIDISPLPKAVTLESGSKVALLIPQKNIGRYSATSADSILLYLIAHGDNFDFQVFDSQNEEVNNLVKAYESAKMENYNIVIAILSSPKSLGNLLENVEVSVPIYIPTINKKDAGEFADFDNVFFGGIDYGKQMEMIAELSKSKNASIISLNDDGRIGQMLGTILKTKTQNIIFNMSIDTKTSNNFKIVIPKIRSNLKSSIVVLNTSVIKSGLIVPQIGNTRAMPKAFLSSQINYNLSLISLMPKEDTERLFIISAIAPFLNEKLITFGELMNSDLQYDWVNYATALGLDIFMTQGNKNAKRFFDEVLEGNQVQYNDRFYGVQDSHFVPVKLK